VTAEKGIIMLADNLITHLNAVIACFKKSHEALVARTPCSFNAIAGPSTIVDAMVEFRPTAPP
jgi:hypothetical protein